MGSPAHSLIRELRDPSPCVESEPPGPGSQDPRDALVKGPVPPTRDGVGTEAQRSHLPFVICVCVWTCGGPVLKS